MNEDQKINNPAQAIARILGSSKGVVAIIVIALAFGALFANRATWEQVRSLLEWTLGSWFVTHAAEDVSKHIANSRSKPVDLVAGEILTTTATVVEKKEDNGAQS